MLWLERAARVTEDCTCGGALDWEVKGMSRARMMNRLMGAGPTVIGLGVIGLSVGLAAPAAAESRSFVANWFSAASYTQPENCPNGLNPSLDQEYAQELIGIGMPRDKVE